jgi:hypothetical protein
VAETTAEPDPLDEARSLVEAATERGIVLRLVGGLAVRLLCPELPPRVRSGQDLDFCSLSTSRPALIQLLTERGYLPDKTFNALYGNKQLYFADPATSRAVDVLIDKLEMCHTLDFSPRISRMAYTLGPLDLLLSKLQIVELNEKDADDCLQLLVTYPIAGTEPAAFDEGAFATLLGDDWGWWRTVTNNLKTLRTLLESGQRAAIAGGYLDPLEQIARLERSAEQAPKSRRWKLRARVGERVRWYENPEETAH